MNLFDSLKAYRQANDPELRKETSRTEPRKNAAGPRSRQDTARTEPSKGGRPVFNCPKPQSTAITRRAEELCDLLVKAGCRELLMTDFRSPLCSQALECPDQEWAEAELQKLAAEMWAYLGLAPIPVIVEAADISNGPQFGRHQAGFYSPKGCDSSVTIFFSPYQSWPQHVAILCHEVTHYFMTERGIRFPNSEENEMNTDITANLIGFRNQMLSGLRSSTYAEGWGPWKTSGNSRVGYITALDCGQAGQYLDYYRAKLRYPDEVRQWRASRKDTLRQKTETAEMLYEQFAEELRHPASFRPGPGQMEEIQQAILEHGSRDIPAELRQCREPLALRKFDEAAFDAAEARADALLSDLLRWRSAFRIRDPE